MYDLKQEERIPIALKFTHDDMYYNFIKPARDNKGLTRLIQTLLRAYYEDTDVQRLVDMREAGETELQALNDAIEMIALEHSKSVAQLRELKFDVDSATEDMNIPVQEERAQNNDTSNNALQDQLLSLIQNLTAKVDNLETKLNVAIPDFDKELGIATTKVNEAPAPSYIIPEVPEVIAQVPVTDSRVPASFARLRNSMVQT